MNKTIHNVETNEITIVPLTVKELADLEQRQLKSQEIAAEIALKEAEAATAKAALLERLGITADEAALLLG